VFIRTVAIFRQGGLLLAYKEIVAVLILTVAIFRRGGAPAGLCGEVNPYVCACASVRTVFLRFREK